MFADRIVIPHCFRKQVLQRLHQDHPGQFRMKSLARSFVYWPKIDKQIEEFVKTCDKCIEASKSPIRIPLQPWLHASAPWTRIHMDFAGPVQGRSYFIVVDAYSKWPEVFETVTTTSDFVIKALSSLFAKFGNPETIVSDNGPQFVSAI